MTHKLIIFVSGNGSNLQAIVNACESNLLNATVTQVFCNQPNAYALERAQYANIPTQVFTLTSKKNKKERINYEQNIITSLNQLEYDLIILAGWMHILSNTFLHQVKSPVINLHPALPNQFPGINAIEKAFKAYQQGKINNTGIMVHHVVEKVDAGAVIEKLEVPIYTNDTLSKLTNRVRYYEKFVLIKAIDKIINNTRAQDLPMIYQGKVRAIHDLGYNLYAFCHSNKQSAFDRHICMIPQKGIILTKLSEWWFNKTQHIVPNHFLYAYQNTMICKKAYPFKIEVVVRGYITGSTSTSLWTHYNKDGQGKGERVYCGITFPDNLVKNQKLKTNIVTPTTKGEVDIPISDQEIIDQGYMSSDDWTYVKQKALELFNFGQLVAEKQGLILVDTKYEFGKDSNGQIMLIDEIHTCDSSRYWIKATYEERFHHNKEPEKLDKDMIRDYIIKRCDPYQEDLPEIPPELVTRVQHTYIKFYEMLTNQTFKIPQKNKTLLEMVQHYFNNVHNKMAIILAGSDKDESWIKKINDELHKHRIYSKVHIASAHKKPRDVLDIIDYYETSNKRIVYITVAGMANALGGVVSANTKYPTINCPPYKDKIDMATNLQSSIQNPSFVPSMFILSPSNVALATKKILEL